MQLCPRGAKRRRRRGARCAPQARGPRGCRAEEGAARPATHPWGRGPRHPMARPAGPHCPRRQVPSHTPPACARPGPAGRGRQTFSSARRRGRLSRLSASGRSSPGRAAGPSLSPTPGRRPGRAPIHSRRPRRSRTWPWLMVGPDSRALTWLEQRRRRPQGAGRLGSPCLALGLPRGEEGSAAAAAARLARPRGRGRGGAGAHAYA